ncbi:MAG: YitT family protein [Chitinophagaceae bacterium]|nr:YitT family protein [Chitinophagaceae bacterium]
MQRFIKEFIIQKIGNNFRKKSAHKPISNYDIAKEFVRFRVSVFYLFKDIFYISLGIVSAGFGLKGFLLPNNFIDGGATGISLLISSVTLFSFPVLIVLINIPFVYMGYKQLSKGFAIKSFIAILALAIVVATVDYPIITSDKLLVAAFGGFFLGAGIGLSIRGGGVIDGTEVLSIYISRKTGLTIGDILLFVNIIIFSVAAYLLSVETALYSILTYLAASKTVDFIVEGVEEYTGVTIISSHASEIKKMLTDTLGRGFTVYQGKSGFGRRGENSLAADIIYTVITRLEIARLQAEVEKIDPNAFMVMSSVKDTKGGMIKKRPLVKD